MTLVVGGASKGPTDLEAAAEEAISLASDGMKLRAAAGHAAQRHGVAKNDVYELALKTHHQASTGSSGHESPRQRCKFGNARALL